MRNKDLQFSSNPTLLELQLYVTNLEKVRGFDKTPNINECLMLGEEVGELFKSVRKIEGGRIDYEKSKVKLVSEEIADILILLTAIANRYNISILEALKEKEEENKKRSWE